VDSNKEWRIVLDRVVRLGVMIHQKAGYEDLRFLGDAA